MAREQLRVGVTPSSLLIVLTEPLAGLRPNSVGIVK
jgi:hypothetical protein